MLFVSVTGVLFAGTYFILKTTREKIMGQNNKRTNENKIGKVVWIVYYLMIAIVTSIILQIIFFSSYYAGLLSIVPTISYGLAVYIMGLLACYFFSWFRRNRTLVVLLYGIASISASIYVGLMIIIFNVVIFTHQPTVITPDVGGNFRPLETELREMVVSTLPAILTASTFLSFWGGTISILIANIRRVGKTRFWILVTAPIIFFLGALLTYFPELQEGTPQDDLNSIVIPFYIIVFSQFIAIGLFAIAFVSMARAVPHHRISNYMYYLLWSYAIFYCYRRYRVGSRVSALWSADCFSSCSFFIFIVHWA